MSHRGRGKGGSERHTGGGGVRHPKRSCTRLRLQICGSWPRRWVGGARPGPRGSLSRGPDGGGSVGGRLLLLDEGSLCDGEGPGQKGPPGPKRNVRRRNDRWPTVFDVAATVSTRISRLPCAAGAAVGEPPVNRRRVTNAAHSPQVKQNPGSVSPLALYFVLPCALSYADIEYFAHMFGNCEVDRQAAIICQDGVMYPPYLLRYPKGVRLPEEACPPPPPVPPALRCVTTSHVRRGGGLQAS